MHTRKFSLVYDQPEHRELPHVVKFSGGRSSAMLLMLLLTNKQLRPSRGDVVVFNNTSAEHRKTYDFVRKCKKITEREFGVPFFITEFQTYEDAWLGKWRRASTYRLARATPHRNYKNRRSFGFRHKGEIFEEFVSWQSQLPTRFARTCTEYLKLQTTAHFLADWFGRCGGQDLASDRIRIESRPKSVSDKTKRLGHYYDESQMPHPREYGEREHIVKFHFEQPSFRDAQSFREFTDVDPLLPFQNDEIPKYVFDYKAELRGENALPFISLIGLRADEPARAARVFERNNTAQSTGRLADGEYVYAPLFGNDIFKHDVIEFWNAQSFDLELPYDVNLSNCVFCFMKGVKSLVQLVPYSSGKGPSNVEWWADFETKYSRTLQRRGEPNGVSTFGFFGANTHTYDRIIARDSSNWSGALAEALPCECTD